MFFFYWFQHFSYRKFVSPPIFPRSKQCRTSLSQRSPSRMQLAHVCAEIRLKYRFSAVFCFCVSFFFPHRCLSSIQFYSFPRFILYPLNDIFILSFLSLGYSSFVLALFVLCCTTLFLPLFSSMMFFICFLYFLLFDRKELLYSL
jgi:hypothetical protein